MKLMFSILLFLSLNSRAQAEWYNPGSWFKDPVASFIPGDQEPQQEIQARFSDGRVVTISTSTGDVT